MSVIFSTESAAPLSRAGGCYQVLITRKPRSRIKLTRSIAPLAALPPRRGKRRRVTRTKTGEFRPSFFPGIIDRPLLKISVFISSSDIIKTKGLPFYEGLWPS